jgi:hypothetical protein
MNRKSFNSVKPLPCNFADQILKLEISVEISPSLDTLRSLLELYSVSHNQQAIEYYESLKDPRFKYYQDRMNTCLSKQSNLLLKDPKTPDLKEHRKAEQEIKQFERKSEIISRQVSLNLEKQNSSVLKRFLDRKSRNTSEEAKRNPSNKGIIFKFKTTAQQRKPSEGESDVSAGSAVKNVAEFEVELEKIMESSVLEKVTRSSEIRSKYQLAMDDIGGKSGIFKQVTEEIKKNMEKELKDLDSELEGKRRQKIREARSNIFCK